ncbi:MAG: response regulator [Chlorobiaceae bacterium]|nr:response regulator [Chlorobiaceae bacterium]
MPATSPLQALRIAQQHQHRIDLLVTDVSMPEMNGFELADRLKFVIPNLKILFMSGYVDKESSAGARDVNFLPKPFSLRTLSASVKTLLDGPAG